MSDGASASARVHVGREQVVGTSWIAVRGERSTGEGAGVLDWFVAVTDFATSVMRLATACAMAMFMSG
eukprot:3921983-Pleurochrysis_carterae.AAC.1